MRVLVDSHVHLHEIREYSRYCNRAGMVLLAVSDDLKSSELTLSRFRGCRNVVPAVGIHPWEVGGSSEGELRRVLELAEGAPFIGEVGLDRRFVSGTYGKQLRFFREFVDYASSKGKGMSIHAAGAWREVLEVLKSSGVRAAVIHWYTGPRELIEDIESMGYFIGVNAAIKVQRKMVEVVKHAPLEVMLTESDAPYEYRGVRLMPELVPEVISAIARVKGVDEDVVASTIFGNFRRLLGLVGIDLSIS